MIIKLLLCIIINRIAQVVLFLVSGWNCTPVMNYQFTCPAASRHAIRKCCCLSSSTAAGRRVWFDGIQKREHCWISAFTDFDDYCGVHYYGTPNSRGVTAYEELNSCSLLLFHPIHSYCSHCYFVYCFQGTIVVVGSCIYCTITASRMKYYSSLFSWSY